MKNYPRKPTSPYLWALGKFFCTSIFLLFLTLIPVKGQNSRGMAKPTGDPGKRLALVIGNSVYSYKPLPNVRNDAQDMAATLRLLGFEVILKENLSKEEMVTVISDFTFRLRQYSIGLFYFAGHGFMSTQKENFLMSVGVKENMNESFAKSNSISLDDVMSSMDEARTTPTKILIVDACRNNPYRSWGRSDQKGLGSVTAPEGLLAFFAASANEEASENTGKRNGLFTQELLIQLKTPNLNFDELIRNTSNAVKRQNPNQRPYRVGDLSDVFYFNPKYTPPPPPRLTNGTTRDLPFGPRMVYVEGGTFQMGSNEGEADELPLHPVTLTDFWIAQTEVTVGQYLEFCTATNSHWPAWLETGNDYHVETGKNTLYKDKGYSRQASQLPIVGVSWHDAVAYADWLTQKTGVRHALPTEAQWEFAAGGGNLERTRFGNGTNVISPKEANFDARDSYKKDYSVVGEYPGKPIKVGSLMANALGLHDMSGNVWEWCRDWYAPNWYAQAAASQPNPENTNFGRKQSRVLRGGSWNSAPINARVAFRNYNTPDSRFSGGGFRVMVSQVQ